MDCRYTAPWFSSINLHVTSLKSAMGLHGAPSRFQGPLMIIIAQSLIKGSSYRGQKLQQISV